MRTFVVLRAKRKEQSYSARRVQTTRAQERGSNFRRERDNEERKKIVQKGETVGTHVFRVYLLP